MRATRAVNGREAQVHDPWRGLPTELVAARVYFLAFSLAGPETTPYREVDQQRVFKRQEVAGWALSVQRFGPIVQP
jgi:hypothetical protein